MLERLLPTALVVAACLGAPAAASAQEAVGAWHGVLVIGPNVLRVVIHVKAADGGKLGGELISPDQSPQGFALGDVKLAGDTFSFAVPQILASFEGKWDPARGSWKGTFKQGPASLPMVLDKGDLAPAAPAAAPPPAAAVKPPASKALEGVTVTGQSQGTRLDIDRRSYDITKDLQAQTGSIADALRNVPSVQVDLQGNISLRGDPSVTIMIDGKPSALFKGPSRGQVLQNLPANAFERVEVMTNPSAAYRPDGTGGIINLIPKKARQVGRAGSVRVTAAAGEKAQLNLSLSQVGKALTLSGDAAWAHEKQRVTLKDERASLDPLSGQFLASVQDVAVQQRVDVFNGHAAFDYDPDAKTRFSGQVRGAAIRVDSHNAVDFTGQAPGSLAPIGYDSLGKVTIKRDNLSINGSWRRKLGAQPDHELVVDLTQEHNTDRTSAASNLVARGPGVASRAEAQRIDSDTDQSHVKVDYTLPFDSGAKLKAGYELEYDQDDFDNFGLRGPTPDTVTPDAAFIDQFRFDQAINGVYATWQQPLDKLTVLAGLRVEDTQIDMKDLTTGFRGTNKDTHLYPSLHLSWKVDDAQELRASYSQRIARPQPADYNPFRRYQDPFNFRAGNPGLKPQQTHSFELGYQYRKGFTYYLATLYYRQNEKGVTDVITDLGSGVFLTTKQNLTESRNGGLELTAVRRLNSKLSFQLRGDAFWNEIDASDLGFGQKRSAWTMSGGAVLNWQVTPKDQFQLVANVVPKRLTPQGYHKPIFLTFAGYRHVFNKDWSLSVSARDLLGSYTDTFVIDTPTLRDRNETHVKLRAIFLQLTYSFGSGARKDTGIDYGTSGVGAGGASPR